MRMTHTEEQEMLQRSVRKFFNKEAPIELIRELQTSDSSGHSEVLWKKMGEAGWLSIAVPENFNGAGGTLFDLGIVYEEAGRVLLPTAFYSTKFASFLIEAIGTEKQKQEYLSSIASGETIATIAHLEPHAIHNTDSYTTVARKDKGRYYLTGTKSFVSNANVADLIIVIARSEDDSGREGLTAFLVSPKENGIAIKSQQTFGKDKQSIIYFTEVELGEENVLGKSELAESGLNLAINKATALQTMEMVGGMKRMIEMTIDYVSERKQFDVPIGSFQAVQHHLANMAIQRDGSELVAYQSVLQLSDGLQANREIAIAKAYVSESYKEISVMAHQLWGGMGYATESDLHIWSNRAKATELSFGTRDYHLNQLTHFIGNNQDEKQKVGSVVSYS